MEWNGIRLMDIRKTQIAKISDYISNPIAPPAYVTSGLTLYLDAGKTSSYPGSGSTWTDLSQNLSFTSTGGSPSFSTVAGYPAFTFNGSQYWVHSATPSAVDLGGDCTLLMWMYPSSLAARKTIFEKAGTIYNSYEQELAMTWETDNSISYYSRYNTYDFGYFRTLTNSQWQMWAIKMSTGKTSAARTGFYSKNGASWTSEYTSRSSSALTPAGEIRIGTGYAGTVTNGSIAIVMAYNKMLSDAEILQNYNVFKTQFGL